MTRAGVLLLASVVLGILSAPAQAVGPARANAVTQSRLGVASYQGRVAYTLPGGWAPGAHEAAVVAPGAEPDSWAFSVS